VEISLNAKVILSNGFGNFHLAQAAQTAQDRDELVGYITGGYPPAWMARRDFTRSPALLRLAERDCGLPRHLVYDLKLAELTNRVAGIGLSLPAFKGTYDMATSFAMRVYQHGSHGALERLAGDANVFHYRSGFAGSQLLAAAKRRGLLLLCDHSIAHPEVLPHLVASLGRNHENTGASMSHVERVIVEDLRHGDAFLVNSDFVKNTFIERGIAPERIYVVYTLPEARFLQHAAPGGARGGKGKAGRLRVLFGGTVTARKGAEALLAIIAELSPVMDFTVAGTWDLRYAGRRREIESLPGVKVVGQLARMDLARAMACHDVFLFPTLAEGSARVVAEAMSASCALVTTPNAGSLIPSDDPCQIVPPWDVPAMVEKLLVMRGDLALVETLGIANQEIIARSLVQGYGARVGAVYADVLGC
jgi:glycosyltransferase involved in cell wall biosynthesis